MKVDPYLARLLDEVAAFIRRYVVLDQSQADELALWVMHTHAIDAADATPYQQINSAEKESGKTRLLEVLDLVVARPWLTGRVTSAVLARKVDAERPTLLLDESDAAFNGEKEYAETLRGILNTGYLRGGKSSICVGQGTGITYKDLGTFSPKAIAGLDALPDTVASRSIAIRLKRKSKGEQVERFRRRQVQEISEPLHQALVSLADLHVDHLAEARPDLPDELTDRQQDVWEPLLAIADLAGDDWARRARSAALALTRRDEAGDDSIRVRLLADCRHVFDGQEKLATKDLLALLERDEEAPWVTWHRGSPISPRALARLLVPFGIHSRTIRVADATPRGYLRESFEDAWDRYLTPHTPDLSATTPQPASVQGLRAPSIRNTTPNVADRKVAANPHEQTNVADVADRTPGKGGGDDLDGPKLPPIVGDPDYPDFVDDRFHEGHLTELEWLDRRKLHSVLAAA